VNAAPDALVDRFGRRVTYLRVSLTDRCNHRCTYCMPERGVALGAHAEVLRFEELVRLAGVFARLGVERFRLTGGEPTVRHGVVALVEKLAGLGVRVVMTSNGQRLAELAAPLAAAGLAEVNVSLDSLDPARFARITRRGDLAAVRAGIDAAVAAGLPLKTNTVALAGFNDDELLDICRHAWERGALPRFIEWMPMSGGSLYAPGALLAAAEIRRRLGVLAGGPLVPGAAPAGVVGPARYYLVPGGGRVGIIAAISEHFCAGCNRLRLTAAGGLCACLARDESTDLRTPLRAGASDDELAALIRQTVAGKRAAHAFDRQGEGGPRAHMVSIGG
jgi:cyclic pyranopterin phosphate synthase